ncbi:MAG TPA: 5-carboxymethyl-2-hydroxymuconate semialdehyde dehydrogenase [Nitrososphaerales archaeon]|nr:5-carboxymethyl-2-hydroxymuconate semialdehyde dehydrogenase [Nitrososphaerales archaeon]
MHFIDGEFVPSLDKRTFEAINPATNRVITSVSEGGPKEIDLAVKSALGAFSGRWRNITTQERSNLLLIVAEGIEKRIEEFARVETLDTGIPIKQTRGQMKRAAENFRFFASAALQMRDAAFPVGNSFFNYSERKPVGVAGLITPWNTPMMLETWKIAPCLAAGNTCVLKPAEWSPLSANLLAKLFQDSGFPKGVFNVVNGLGETAGASLVAHPGVRLISFTGETTTGKEIMRNGAPTLKRFSMELGGKSPAIIFADGDLERSLDAIIFGVYSLNGERCTANSRLLLEESIYEKFISALKERILQIRVGDPFDERTELGPLIHPEHWKRVADYIEIGKKEGATVAVGGERPEKLKDGNYLEATLLTKVKNSMRVAQEEIFGPVLVAMPFKEEKQALEIANDVKYGLASYVWTKDLEKAHRVASKIEAGLVWINSQNVRDLRTPFGGSKESGIGREGGEYSFDFYTEQKTVHVALGNHPIPKMGTESSVI